jgi:hypothetical protein
VEEQVVLTIDAPLAEGVPPETDVCFTVRAEWPSERKAPLPTVNAKVETNGDAFAEQVVPLE